MRPRRDKHDNGQREYTDHHGQAGQTSLPPGEVRIPRQRDADTPRVAPSGTPSTGDSHGGRAGRGAPRLLVDGRADARRVLARLWAWWHAVGMHWVTYWPELASLSIGARAARETTARALRALWRWVVAGSRAARWCWAHCICLAARTTGRLARRVAVRCWPQLEAHGRDAAGWLVHTAPGLAGQALLRLLRWLPVALARLLRHAAVGLGWLLARLVRYCLA